MIGQPPRRDPTATEPLASGSHRQVLSSPDADSLRLFRTALACGIVVLNRAGEVIEVNEAAATFLGLSRDQLYGRTLPAALAASPWRAVQVDGSPLDPTERPSLTALRTRQPQRAQLLGLTRPDGATHWVHIDATPILASDGQPELVVTNFIDVTAYMELLRQWEGLEQATAQLTSDFVYTFTIEPDGRVGCSRVTASFTTLTGFTHQEMEARGWEMLPHPEDRAVIAERWAAIRAGQPDVREYRLLTKTGAVRWVRDAVLPVIATDGRVHVYGAAHDLTERKHVEEALAHFTLHDALTDLPNRTLFQDRLRQALYAAQREGKTVGLLLLDLHRFGEINEALGHQAGDGLMQQIADRLRRALRTCDTVARLGGDEFAVLFHGSGSAGALRGAQRLLTCLEAPFTLDGQQPVRIGARSGIALYPTHGQDTASLLRHAAVALDRAKHMGRRYVLYDATQDHHSPARLQLMADLHHAVVRDELVLYYQPSVDCASGQVQRVEALVRWRHPQRGLVPPDQFIPLAEQMGLMGPITLWVLEAALRQCQVWHQAGVPLGMNVNLSMTNLHDRRLPELIAGLLRTYDVAPSALRLEVTESIMMADIERTVDVLTRLEARGVGIAVDDFGTGFSSLAYLKRLPVHELKIDQSFVRSLTANETDATIVCSTIGLGHNLGLGVVAEGVEDQQTLDLLRQWGCDAVQGYYFSRPLPAGELEHWLRDRLRGGRRRGSS